MSVPGSVTDRRTDERKCHISIAHCIDECVIKTVIVCCNISLFIVKQKIPILS